MSQTFINGAKYAFSTTLGDAVPITGITNASPAVASTASPPTEGTIVLLASNWTELNDRATYAGAAAGGGFELENIDTTDELRFPDGESAGSFRLASDFVSLSQIREIAQSGGDTNSFTWGYVDESSPRQMSKPTDQNPLILTFTLDYDPNMPWAPALEAITRSRQLTVMRERLPTGDTLLYTGYIAYQKSPSRVRNENMTVTATMSVNSDILRFPAAFFAGS